MSFRLCRKTALSQVGESRVAAGNGGGRTISGGLSHSGPGSPIAPAVRQTVEPGLGADLGGVRVHSDGAAHQAARSLQARAFTHGQDIWLGPGESPTDTRLMAHETAHVVQQTGDDDSLQMIQRAPADYQHPEDVNWPRQNMQEEIDKANREAEQHRDEGEEPSSADRTQFQNARQQIDPSELEKKKGDLGPEAQPTVDRPAEEKPKVDQAATETKGEVEQPTEPLAEGEAEEPGPGEESQAAEADAVTNAQNAAAQAYAVANASQVNEMPDSVEPPEINLPVDAGGQPLPANPVADSQILGLAEKVQMIRDQGLLLRQSAAEQRGNAAIIRGNIRIARGGIQQADQGLTKSESHLEYRREVLQQGSEALTVNEEKTDMVAEKAPELASKADEGKEDSEPMATEASEMVSENEANTPEDGEAASKSRDQGQKMNQVGDQSQTMDDAIGQTRERAESLGGEAEEARSTNEQTGEGLNQLEGTLDQTDERLGQLRSQNEAAGARLDGVAAGPDQMIATANMLDQQGATLIQSSYSLEDQVQVAQEEYESGMEDVPELNLGLGQSRRLSFSAHPPRAITVNALT